MKKKLLFFERREKKYEQISTQKKWFKQKSVSVTREFLFLTRCIPERNVRKCLLTYTYNHSHCARLELVSCKEKEKEKKAALKIHYGNKYEVYALV